jgi:hypothetical protein
MESKIGFGLKLSEGEFDWIYVWVSGELPDLPRLYL